MTRSTLLAFMAGFVLASPSLIAQDAPVVFSTYYECSQSSEDDLDPIVMSFIAPIYDALVEDGSISNWGWSAHRFGGDWRRLGSSLQIIVLPEWRHEAKSSPPSKTKLPAR